MELKKLKISDKKIEILQQLHITQVEDLLTYYPFRYESIEELSRDTWKKDDRIAVEGVIVSKARKH